MVPTGQGRWHLGQTLTSADCAAHLADVHRQLPAMARYDWVVDHLNTHWSLEVCRLVATWCHLPCTPKTLLRGVQRRTFLSDPTQKHVCHLTPQHGAWLHQVALWLSVLARRFLKRGDCCSPADFPTRQRQGRAWFSPRPHCFERALYPPRPYKRATTQLTMNL